MEIKNMKIYKSKQGEQNKKKKKYILNGLYMTKK